MNSLFKKGMPEDAGIPSSAVLKVMELLKEKQVEIHSFYMQYQETCVAECYYKPFDEKFLHRMYSVSKSLTSLAIGLLVEEEKLGLESRIGEYFKDKWPEEGVHPWIEAMTIKDLLTMSTAHQSTTYKRYDKGDWVESFFRVTPSHLPGSIFNYDTSASHVLAALVERLTGKEMMEYLREKFWDEMGCSKTAHFLKDPYGVSQGGSGLMCTTRDLAAVAYLCTQGGCYNNKRFLPEEYLAEATSCKRSTVMQPYLDESFGYGYQIWKNRKDGFTFYGMGGQLAICFPRYQFFIVTTANTIGRPADLQALYEAFYEEIYPWLEVPCKEVDAIKQIELIEAVKEAEVTPVLGDKAAEWFKEREGKIYELESNPMGIKWLCFEETEQGIQIIYENLQGKYEIEFGYGKCNKHKLPGFAFECLSSGAWLDEHTLLIKVSRIEEECVTWKIQVGFIADELVLNVKQDATPFMVCCGKC